jgi:hypothetical protein
MIKLLIFYRHHCKLNYYLELVILRQIFQNYVQHPYII